MTVWSWDQIWNIWVDNGGDRNTAVWAAAVATAESGGNDQAVSLSDDWGLWQINAIHFAEFHTWAGAVLEPNLNARIAIAISQNGHNWAPWCTAWHPSRVRFCGSGYLPSPEVGSPAWSKYQEHLGQVVNTPILPNFGMDGAGSREAHAAWATVGTFFGSTIPYVGNYAYGIATNTYNARNAWRPPT